MSEEEKKLISILGYLDELKDILDKRPRMLGTPYEINSTLFYLDAIELLAKGYEGNSFFEVSWTEFLVQKKLIIGAEDSLRNKLKKSDEDYSELQILRKEYFSWRKKKIGF
jgi:hypothetical protein